jgi:hypothetical protein
MFPKQYKYLIGAGLILFGFFALKFQEYQHPIYGYINFGKYHIYIGAALVTAGAVYIYHVMSKNIK